ncbi:hypothetical protein ACFOTA_16030 [Chitinophaga sp. GCM10012297]|uniref:Lipoprotein n=1 Tax=Chitinophaga chungangae TaxID=2821488 RepID=A0ABS3YHH1_9BACT|nr:hypothetical protein [Chitinophaga chungangae]MBO9153728.1 hypothetical protein [Chitinophaga chungangae]
MKRCLIPIGFALIATACQQPPAVRQIQDSIHTDPTTADTADVVAEPTERDTVTIAGVLYNIIDISQAEFEAVPGYRPLPENEKENIARYAGKIFRSGDSLMLKLENDSMVVLKTNRSDNEDYADYHFLDYMPALKAYLVYVEGYEYFAYLLVDANMGRVTNTIGVPQLSPDKKMFVSSNEDLVAAFTTNGFELFRMGTDSLELVQERQPEKWGPVIIKWKDARSFVGHFNELDEEINRIGRYVKLVPR